MITINFGMVVAIYYFLHGAKLALKIFTFFAYTVGMLVLLGEMLVETNVKAGVVEALRALPRRTSIPPNRALPCRLRFLGRAYHAHHLQSLHLVVLVRRILSCSSLWKRHSKTTRLCVNS